jgi:hypothetical protein
VSEPITEADALRRFPELSPLVTIREAGWTFRPMHDDQGRLIGISGSWSRRQYTDAIFVFDRTHVAAARVLADEYGGGCVWMRDGTDIQEVVTDLLALPEPGASGAPTLVKRSSLLWTP